MKNLFMLSEEDRNRILNLHETATKRQYIINEVGYGTNNWVDVNYKAQTLTLNNYLEMENKEGGDELKLNKGVVFTVKNTNTLIAKNTPFQIVGDYTGRVIEDGNADVEYYCDTKIFKIIGRNLTYWGENFQSNTQKAFDDLCGEASAGGQSSTGGQTQEQNKTKSVEAFNTEYPCVPKKGKIMNFKSGIVGYLIGDYLYFPNGYKYQYDSSANKYVSEVPEKYSCDDEEFKQRGATNMDTNVSIKTPITPPSDVDLTNFLNS